MFKIENIEINLIFYIRSYIGFDIWLITRACLVIVNTVMLFMFALFNILTLICCKKMCFIWHISKRRLIGIKTTDLLDVFTSMCYVSCILTPPSALTWHVHPFNRFSSKVNLTVIMYHPLLKMQKVYQLCL